MRTRLSILAAAVLLLGQAFLLKPVAADTVMAATAANFLPVMATLEGAFEAQTGHELIVAGGSTGSLYAQIANGAPYDVYLAADEERPGLAIRSGHAVEGSEFTYAIGRLVLYSSDAGLVAGPEALSSDFRYLAIANPRTAPYGAAAIEVLEALGLRERLAGRIAHAQSVNGAHAAIVSGSAELGFVAASNLHTGANQPASSYWQVPQTLYSPLRQSAVLLERGAGRRGPSEFLAFLRSTRARAIIAGYGYGLD